MRVCACWPGVIKELGSKGERSAVGTKRDEPARTGDPRRGDSERELRQHRVFCSIVLVYIYALL